MLRRIDCTVHTYGWEHHYDQWEADGRAGATAERIARYVEPDERTHEQVLADCQREQLEASVERARIWAEELVTIIEDQS